VVQALEREFPPPATIQDTLENLAHLLVPLEDRYPRQSEAEKARFYENLKRYHDYLKEEYEAGRGDARERWVKEFIEDEDGLLVRKSRSE
jgi:hypothetical protein